MKIMVANFLIPYSVLLVAIVLFSSALMSNFLLRNLFQKQNNF